MKPEKTEQATDEERWIDAARNGDKAAFGRLVELYQNPLYNLSYRMLGNGPGGRGRGSGGFHPSLQTFASYDPDRAFSTWLFSITSHYCIDQLRRRKIDWMPLKEEIAEPVRLAKGSPNPETVVTERDRESWIKSLLTTLSPTDRAAITLHYWYDCSYAEIAEVLDLTASAVKSRLYRARRALAEQMKGEAYALQES